jgi:N-acetylmuramic acid 6-phosphate etherase
MAASIELIAKAEIPGANVIYNADCGSNMNREQPSTLAHLTTEASNPASAEIDTLSAIEIVRLMNEQDALIAAAVAKEADSIAQAIDVIADRFRIGGRLLYIGAGTSGRLGVLDASECPPTFSTPPEMVVGLIAGGHAALTRAIEGAEDHPEVGERDLVAAGLTADDVVVGIATSGRTPYVIGGLRYASHVGAFSIGFSCNEDCDLRPHSRIMISPVVGAEVISGSTRMKAGTATKMVLNMLTTGAMVRIGKTYGNLMVDLTATNEKLTLRSCRIVSGMLGIDPADAQVLLDRCDGEVKTAIVAGRQNVSPEAARQLLSDADGHLRRVLDKES